MNSDCSSIYIVSQVTEYDSTEVQAQASKDIQYVCLQFVYAGSFISMCPRVAYTLTGYPQRQVVFFLVWRQCLFCIALVSVIEVSVTEFEELQVGILTVGIVLDAFETTEQQSLTHHVQVVAQWVHQVNEVSRSECFQTFVITGSSQ